ncbi:ABC transporter substrate-binding protein [uncultured Desulfovibrio sp.]|uniref:ABC transporter substrate-binding protein n=1 Tax=uncultured Desulfovibrio sp. TaxID=167968 RepID=UPI002637BEB2|nr:ABC transporter substrate-binding protein [uncultured Desulfovibrio sp.]
MRKFICLLFTALFVFMTLQPLQAADKPEKIRIGYLSLVNGQLISKYLQLHEKEMGIPIEWFRFNSGRDVNTAMASNSLDFGNVGLPPATIGLAGDMDYWGIMNANVLGKVESLVVRKDINSLKDLEGKTVVAPFGSTTHYLLIKALRDAKVDMSKVKIMDMAPGEALAPFIRGDIDAAYIWEPSLGLVVQHGGKILLTSEQMAQQGYLTWDVISVQPAFAKKYPELVTKFIKSELAAMDYWREHPEEAAKIIAKELGGISIDDAKRMMAGTRLIGLEEQLSPSFLGTSEQKGQSAKDIVDVAAFLLEQGRIKNSVSQKKAEDFLHPEFLEALRDGKTVK